jgi:hypothetical protein
MTTQKQERQIWPERYRAFLTVDDFSHKEQSYNNVTFCLFQPDVSPDEIKALLDTIGDDSLKDNSSIAAQVVDTFSAEETGLMHAYFSSILPGSRFNIQPALIPSTDSFGVSEVPLCSVSGYCIFAESKSYTLNFKVWGHYWIEEKAKGNRMLIIELKDIDRWGSARLGSIETWGTGVTRKDRERLGDLVVDAFHRRVKQAGLLIQWQPSPTAPEVSIEGSLMPDMELLEQFLDEAYQEVTEAGETMRVEYSRRKLTG